MDQNHYEWVKQTRNILLDFCEEIEPNDFTRQMTGFGFSSIRNLLVHVADCYIAWLGSFVLLKTKKPLTPKEFLRQMDVQAVRERFFLADKYVNDFYTTLSTDERNIIIEREALWRNNDEIITTTPNKLFIHAITHEFHHKGQIVTMARQMGYDEIPNTDISGVE
ncbi:DinB family protein [Shimazuella sp. AN120528]|uniref:DinB family protein n=1 Tax=Shimazuella soli TaxID=1892854 RepID=UPI001F0FDF12|nr:DinB family protein [Shimazuella soli]MCH5585423.1 DinB family protein [Shimazuella soli]